LGKAAPDFCYPPTAENLQNFFGVFLQFHIGVDNRLVSRIPLDFAWGIPHAALCGHLAERLTLPPNREQAFVIHSLGHKATPLESSGYLLKIPAFFLCVHADNLLVLWCENKKRRPAGRLTNKSAHGFTCGSESRQTGKTLAKEPKIKAPSFLNEGALQGLESLTFSARESFCPI